MYSLGEQGCTTGFIQIPKELFEYVKSRMPGIKRFYCVDHNDLEQSRDSFVKRFKVIRKQEKCIHLYL